VSAASALNLVILQNITTSVSLGKSIPVTSATIKPSEVDEAVLVTVRVSWAAAVTSSFGLIHKYSNCHLQSPGLTPFACQPMP